MVKKGDRLRVRKDLVVGERYGHNTFVVGMECLLGEEVEVFSVFSSGGFAINDHHYNLTLEMMEPQQKKKRKFKLIDGGYLSWGYLEVLSEDDMDDKGEHNVLHYKGVFPHDWEEVFEVDGEYKTAEEIEADKTKPSHKVEGDVMEGLTKDLEELISKKVEAEVEKVKCEYEEKLGVITGRLNEIVSLMGEWKNN